MLLYVCVHPHTHVCWLLFHPRELPGPLQPGMTRLRPCLWGPMAATRTGPAPRRGQHGLGRHGLLEQCAGGLPPTQHACARRFQTKWPLVLSFNAQMTAQCTIDGIWHESTNLMSARTPPKHVTITGNGSSKANALEQLYFCPTVS